MVMSWIWCGMAGIALLGGLATGRGPEVGAAFLSGAGEAVELALSLTGAICLWSGVMEILARSGLDRALAALLRPILGALFPRFRRDPSVMGPLSANVSANLLGLGNAATPFGLKAAEAISQGSPVASDELCLLVVCNTASIQLIPSTVAAVRAAAGSAAPFDILPAVWLASALSVSSGILVCRLLARRSAL